MLTHSKLRKIIPEYLVEDAEEEVETEEEELTAVPKFRRIIPELVSEEEFEEEEEDDFDEDELDLLALKQEKLNAVPKFRRIIPDLVSEEDEEEFEEEDEFDEEELDLLALKRDHPQLYEQFVEVRQYLINKLPQLEVLLEADLALEDKAELIELFEMFAITEPLTSEWLELRDYIKDTFKKAISKRARDLSTDPLEKARIDAELKQLDEYSACEPLDHKIALMNLPVKYKHILYKRYKMLNDMCPKNEEYGKISDWVSTFMEIPFGVIRSLPGLDVVDHIKQRLDEEFYGMDNVKEQLLIYINNRLNNPNMKDYALGLVGVAGTGKTQMAQTLSKILDFPFEQLSGASLGSASGIHGHSYTYIGAEPGDVLKALIRMKCMNGILYIDEFEKVDAEKSMNSLLQLIDPVQNHAFKDRYIGDVPIDLSSTWFILSMNELPQNQALRDRIFPIYLDGYNFKDKMSIMRNHTLPRLIKELEFDVVLDDECLGAVIRRAEKSEGSVGGMRQCIHLLKDSIYKLRFMVQHPNIKVSFRAKLPGPGEVLKIPVSTMGKILETCSNSSKFSALSMYA